MRETEAAIKVIGGALAEESGIDGQQILVSDAAFKAGVTRPSKLDGRSYGMTQTGSSFHYVGSRIAAAEGITLSFRPLQKVGAVIGAVKSGQIDAWSIVPHIAKPLAKSGKVHIIGAVQDYVPNYQITTVFTSAKNATNERAFTESFLAGFTRGVDDYAAAMIDRTDGEDGVNAMVDLIHKYVYTSRPRAKAAPSIKAGAVYMTEGAALDVADLKRQLAWFQAQGFAPKTLTTEKYIDSSFVKK
jgi:NitT/TauT family transport system substrate-binding protein